jgi:hypothetical protein
METSTRDTDAFAPRDRMLALDAIPPSRESAHSAITVLGELIPSHLCEAAYRERVFAATREYAKADATEKRASGPLLKRIVRIYSAGYEIVRLGTHRRGETSKDQTIPRDRLAPPAMCPV